MADTIIILVEDGYRDEEVIYPYYRFKEAGFKVKVVGEIKDRLYTGKFGLSIKADTLPSEVALSDIAAVVIPGGYAPDKMRLNADMVKIVRDSFKASKIIASICHGGQMLVEADIVRDRKVTSYIAVATDLKNAGAEYIDAEVVVDGNLITSRIPDDLPAFCRETIKAIKENG